MSVEIDLIHGDQKSEDKREFVKVAAYPRVGDEMQLAPEGPMFQVLRVIWRAWLPDSVPVVLARPRL